MKRLVYAALMVAISVLAIPALAAVKSDRSTGTSDEALADKVKLQIQNNTLYGIFDWVTVSADNGVVTLNGWYNEPWHKRQFEHQASLVPGVTKVVNNLQKESGSIADDHIRHLVARIIYGNHWVQPFSREPGPPVHIIVDHQNITLEGSVDSKLQRNRAEEAAYSATNAFNIVDHLKIE